MDETRKTEGGPTRHEVRRIGMLSIVKTLFVIGGACGFVFGLIQWLFLQSLMSYSYSATMQGDVVGIPGFPEILELLGTLAWVLPLIGGAGGAASGIVAGVIVSLFYNFAARVWGGIELELRPVGSAPRVAVIPVTRQGETTPLPTATEPLPSVPKPVPEPPPAPTSPSHFFE